MKARVERLVEAWAEWVTGTKWVAEKMLQRPDLSAEADGVSLQPRTIKRTNICPPAEYTGGSTFFPWRAGMVREK